MAFLLLRDLLTSSASGDGCRGSQRCLSISKAMRSLLPAPTSMKPQLVLLGCSTQPARIWTTNGSAKGHGWHEAGCGWRHVQGCDGQRGAMGSRGPCFRKPWDTLQALSPLGRPEWIWGQLVRGGCSNRMLSPKMFAPNFLFPCSGLCGSCSPGEFGGCSLVCRGVPPCQMAGALEGCFWCAAFPVPASHVPCQPQRFPLPFQELLAPYETPQMPPRWE